MCYNGPYTTLAMFQSYQIKETLGPNENSNSQVTENQAHADLSQSGTWKT